MKPYLLLLFLCLLSLQVFANGDTSHIYFPADEAFMTNDTRKQVDKIIGELKTKEKFWLVGYADDRGDKYYNDMLSMRRAQSVAKYLQEKGIPEADIKLSIGKGEINRWASEHEQQRADRRVDIISRGARAPSKEDTVKKIEDVKVGETLKLNNIQFLPGSSMPLPSSNVDFELLLAAMKNNDKLVIRIEGHICCENEPVGNTDGYGYRLSLERAERVHEFLVSRGIAKERLSCVGYSSWRRLRDPEITLADKAANRRVEIRVMKK